MKTVFVIEDESNLRTLICHHLEREAFKAVGFPDAETAYASIQQHPPDAIFLDLMLPGMQGLEFCKILRNRAATARTPILILTAKEEELDKLLGFELGADDYVTKPFSPRELVARLRAVLRRTSERPSLEESMPFDTKDLYVNFATHEVRVRGKEATLSPTEFRLLQHLITHPKIVFSRDQLLDAAWGTETYVLPRTVDVHIQRLRALIEENPGNPTMIVTVRGTGYKFHPGSS